MERRSGDNNCTSSHIPPPVGPTERISPRIPNLQSTNHFFASSSAPFSLRPPICLSSAARFLASAVNRAWTR